MVDEDCNDYIDDAIIRIIVMITMSVVLSIFYLEVKRSLHRNPIECSLPTKTFANFSVNPSLIVFSSRISV